MYNFLLVTEKFDDYNYGYDLLFKTMDGRNITIGNKIIYEDKLYKIIDMDIVYEKINNTAFIKETNIYVEYIQ